MATLATRIAHHSGIPLGGLGTGSVEIRPDGYFHEWQILNLGAWAPRQPECCKRESGPDLPPDALAFFLRTQTGRELPLLRRLGARTDQNDLYSHAWVKSVEEIEFQGRFPVATLRYQDASLPVAVCAHVFSPFFPHDSRASGTPGFHAAFQVRNVSRSAVTVSLLGVLQNPLAHGAPDRRLRNSISRQGRTTFLTMRTNAVEGCRATHGSLGLSATGGDVSWLAGEYPRRVRGFVQWGSSAYGARHEDFLRDFRRAGRLPCLKGETPPHTLLPKTLDAVKALAPAAQSRLLRALLEHPFAYSLYHHVREVDPQALRSHAGRTAFLADLFLRLNDMLGKDRKGQDWGTGALCATVTLAPGETRELRFTLGWHFPYHYSEKGGVLGHQYEHWFKDAEAVNRGLVANYRDHRARTLSFADALYDTTLDPEFADAWSGQLSTLTKCTWWTKAGDFAVWEGLGCCGFHTTDITYQGSFNILALFPDLQKKQMEMGARFQRADGRVHHFFVPDFSQVDNGFDRVDMNQQFVLLACRDYLWTGDRAYLRRLWPHLVRAMDNTARLDRDHDGLPDHDTRRNTYDVWNFFGTPSYIASLWIGALRAAVRLAEERGDRRRAAAWQATLQKAVRSFEKKLWNGEYYSLWVDGARRDECCMTDQMSGEWFTSLAGLGLSLPPARVHAAAQAILKYNFNAEDGLVNASYPAKAKKTFATYGNFQALAPWTGIEYAFASMLLDLGLFDAGRAVVRNIHDRYLRAGRLWNHVECGDHYYRAMCSWAVLLGATGFKVDVPRQVLTVAPAVAGGEFRAPWVSATGWGTFAYSDGAFKLVCRGGYVSFKELRLNLDARRVAAALGARKLAARVARKDGLTVVSFPRAVTVRAGEELGVAAE